MPKRNASRDVYAEQHVARRIAIERARRGWSYDGLAARMTAVGCPLNQSAIYKIERGDPPRRITVDELVAYSRVFHLSVQELLTDPDLAAERHVVDLLDGWRRLMGERMAAVQEYNEQGRRIQDAVRALAGDSVAANAALFDYWKDRYGDSHWATDVPEMFFLEDASEESAEAFRGDAE